MTLVSDILALLRTDLGDAAGELLGDNDVLRALTRSILAVNRDIGRMYQIAGDDINPDLSGDDADLVVLRAHAFCCSMLRSAASANFSFGSGDKRVDKTMQAQAWGDLEKDLLARYREAVNRINPAPADCLLDVGNVRPQIFEVGRHHHHDDH
jgi:hypothetical protein